MKRLFILSAGFLSAGVVLVASSLIAQELGTTLKIPTPAQRAIAKAPAEQGASMATVTPEMWLYMQQQQRHDDPEMAVRRKAEERAGQRQDRIASRRWFGLSNVRPSASPIPTMGSYSPYWAGNDVDPNRWSGVGTAVIQIYDEDGQRIVR